MKVLQIAKFYHPVRGGIESATLELTTGLNRRGFQVDVLCAHRSRRTSRERIDGEYEVIRAGAWAHVLSTSIAPGMISELRRIGDRYDLMHIHMPNPLGALALWLARPACPLVIHWHSDVIRQRRALKFYGPLQNWALDRADLVVATSRAYAEASPWLRRVKEKVRIVPLGIRDDFQGLSLPGERIEQLRGARRLVFSLGRMTQYKGYDVLIEAAALLPSDTRVVVGGGGHLLEQLRAAVERKRLTARISFTGPLSDTQAREYMTAANVFCLPSVSRAEAFGVVLLEAMAAGKPLVATALPGSGVPWVNPEGVTGLNAAPGDPAALAVALRTLLDDALLARQLGQAARKRFETLFTAERMVSDILAIYEHLSSGTPSTP